MDEVADWVASWAGAEDIEAELRHATSPVVAFDEARAALIVVAADTCAARYPWTRREAGARSWPQPILPSTARPVAYRTVEVDHVGGHSTGRLPVPVQDVLLR